MERQTAVRADQLGRISWEHLNHGRWADLGLGQPRCLELGYSGEEISREHALRTCFARPWHMSPVYPAAFCQSADIPCLQLFSWQEEESDSAQKLGELQ